jgi:hypothetical protein
MLICLFRSLILPLLILKFSKFTSDNIVIFFHLFCSSTKDSHVLIYICL